ncbi:MAG: hypothetical protein OSA43_03995, partial [Pirellulales bacterium]|nr:hypothetical protein [Pirellulales bacterium]
MGAILTGVAVEIVRGGSVRVPRTEDRGLHNLPGTQDCAKPTAGRTNSWKQRNNRIGLRWNKDLRPFAEGGRGPSRKISN